MNLTGSLFEEKKCNGWGKMKKIILTLLAAFEIFCGFAQDSASSALAHYRKGMNFQAEHDWYSAGEEFQQALHENPSYGEAWYELAKSTYELNDFALCLTYLESAKKFLRDRTDVLNLEGMCCISLHRLEDAKDIFSKILLDYPNDVNARFGLAEIELFNGSYDRAENFYLDALKMQGSNRKALLSLAVLASENGRDALSENYIRQALKYHSTEAEVHYLAAYLAAKSGNYKDAERRVRAALQLKPDFTEGYILLSSLLYEQEKYDSVTDICDFLINKDRNTLSAWYLKGLALKAQGKNEDAVENWAVALGIDPTDEIIRSSLELVVDKTFPIEDERRSQWAEFHILKAREYSRLFKGEQARYEYQRALKIDPQNYQARSEFAAEIYKTGLNELYLNQLNFIKNTSKVDEASLSEEEKYQYTKTNDTIDALTSLEKYSLASKWGVEPFYLDKTRWNIGFYYTKSNVQLFHPGAEEIAAEMAKECFNGVAVTAVNVEKNPVSNFAQAFSLARKNGQDYFVMLDYEESEREVSLDAVVYNGRNGTQTAVFSLFRTGNDRFASVLRSFRRALLDILPARGKILARNGNEILVDMGKTEGLEKGTVLDVIKKGNIRTTDIGPGVVFDEKFSLGQIVIDATGEEISQGTLTQKSFYDRVNIGDEVLVKTVPSGTAVADTNPAADQNGNSLSTRTEKLSAEDLGLIKTPVFMDLIRKIY